MKENILKDYGWCRISKIDNKYFISFDEGQIVVKMNSYLISEHNARKAIQSEEEAEKLAFAIQKNRKCPPLPHD